MHLDPWPHLIIDDFYDNFESILFNVQGLANKNKSKWYKNVTGLFPPMINIDLLKQFPEYRDFDEVSLEISAAFSEDEFEYKIHCDHPKKILSCITYISPKNSHGTILYNKNKQKHSEIEWKPNRTLIFAPLDGITWHSYYNATSQPRYTLNQFLICPRHG